MNKKEKWLVCGSRIKNNPKYKEIVFKELYRELKLRRDLGKKYDLDFEITIIQGECPDSADIYARRWAWKNGLKVKAYPAKKGGFLARNIKMVSLLDDGDELIAFWDGFSYGTAHTIAQGIMQNKTVAVIDLSEELK